MDRPERRRILVEIRRIVAPAIQHDMGVNIDETGEDGIFGNGGLFTDRRYLIPWITMMTSRLTSAFWPSIRRPALSANVRSAVAKPASNKRFQTTHRHFIAIFIVPSPCSKSRHVISVRPSVSAASASRGPINQRARCVAGNSGSGRLSPAFLAYLRPSS